MNSSLKSDLVEHGLAAIAAADDLAAIESLRISLLGKKGVISEEMAKLGKLPPEQRKDFGQFVNQARDTITAALTARQQQLAAAALQAKLAGEAIDLTLPAPASHQSGKIHPTSQTIEELIAIFAELGFVVENGPDIESDDYNFTRLNFPPDHPAREMHDTFYLPPKSGETANLVLRTHTSPVQVRTMLAQQPPIRIIAPGRTYRSDSDQTHTPMFHQIEGLVIDRTMHMGHLKGCLTHLVHRFFENSDIPLRFRPSFFPFTEPSVEVDIGCQKKGDTLLIGDYGDWLEIGGAGMVHPNVLNANGIDASQFQGFAFGMGIERMAMLKYNIPDLRRFFDCDQRWLDHYGFAPLDIPLMNLAGGGR